MLQDDDDYPPFPGNRWLYDFKIDSISLSFLIVNILIALAIFFATIFTTETYLRRKAKWHQYSIQSILIFTVFIALLLTNAKYDLLRWHGDELWEYFPFFFICLGLWCVFWTAWRLVAMGVGRVGVRRSNGN